MDIIGATHGTAADVQCVPTLDGQAPSRRPGGAATHSRKRREAACRWPLLRNVGLLEVRAAERREGIGGSDANIILSGDATRIRQLWLEKRGEAEPPDLSCSLPVMLGSWTEPFNRQWFERLSGEQIVGPGKRFTCSRYRWRRSTVDGLVRDKGAIWEAKHTSAFAKSDEVLERYMPQLQHNMAVTGLEQAMLSVIFGNHKFEVFNVAADWLYQLELLEAEERFWNCVLRGDEPAIVEAPPPPRPIGTREVCLEGNNAWASAAHDWVKHRESAKIHASACASIKGLVEEDVARTFGHGIEAKRSRSGAITIRVISA